VCKKPANAGSGEAGQLLNPSSCMMQGHIRQTMLEMTISKNCKGSRFAEKQQVKEKLMT
jgi:hypothetical protein